MVDACAVLQARGVPFDALIVGQDDKDGEALRAKIAASGVDVRLPGAVGPEDLLAEYRRAGALCMPCRLLPSDRDGIPNVLVEAMAAGAPVVATERLRHPRAGRARGQRPARRARGPGGARRRADPPARRPGAHAQADRPRPRDGRDPLRRRALARRAGGALPGGARCLTAVRPRPVLCVNEHEHRDRELADAVARRRLHASPERPASSASSPTGCAPSCPRTRSGGSTG